MSQTSYTAAFILIGFLIFITVKGELPVYQAAVLGGAATPAPATAVSTATTAATSVLSSLAPL